MSEARVVYYESPIGFLEIKGSEAGVSPVDLVDGPGPLLGPGGEGRPAGRVIDNTGVPLGGEKAPLSATSRRRSPSAGRRSRQCGGRE